MADNYIGNAKEDQILAEGHRDDLIPLGADGPSPAAVASGEDPGPVGTGTTQFELAQEVPGGAENQIGVFVRTFELTELLKDTTTVDFTVGVNTITSTDPESSLKLSQLKVGQTLLVKGASDNDNNGRHIITAIDYSDPNITITVDTSLATEVGSTITLTQGADSKWEKLEPENDYILDVDGNNKYFLLSLNKGLFEEDFAYVLHKGSATYNFVPSDNSVGPDQLQQNLRNFVVDRFDAVAEDTFALSQSAVSSSSLEVYVDGVWTEGRNEGQVIAASEWALNTDGDTITFDSPQTARVIIKHLGFSTVSRRASLSQGQIGAPPPGSVDTAQLANGSVTAPKLASNAVTETKIQDGAVTTNKIADNSVNGSKILLNNDEYLNALDTLAAEQGLVKLDSSNQTKVNSPNDLLQAIADVVILRLQTDKLLPETDDAVDLGDGSKRFKNARFSGNIENDGNITTHGNIILDALDTVDGVDVSDLESRVALLEANQVSAGMIQMWAQDVAPPSGWLLLDGSQHNIATYPTLYSKIGNSFNTTGDGVSTFNVPDFRQRFPIGKAVSGTGSNWGQLGRGGAIDHTHIAPSHTHDISHAHAIPAHYHGKGTLSIGSSGTHNTSISHNHGSLSVSGGRHRHSIINLTANDDSGSDHKHTVNFGELVARDILNGVDSAHTHTTALYERDSSTAGGSVTRANTNPGGTTVFPSTGAGQGRHTHAVTGIINAKINDSRHTHGVSGTVGHQTSASDGSDHSHTVTLGTQSPTTSSSDGAHTHSNSAFSGSVGNTGGSNGDGSFNTSSQTTSTSGSGGNSATSTSNPPYQVIHFIIKT